MDIVARAKSILISPKTEWRVVAAEPADVASLYTRYIMPLAAIPPVCSFIGLSIIGMAGFRVGIGFGLVTAIVHYIVGLVSVYIAALIASKLAPTFGGRDDMVQGLKLIAYSATAAWVGGLFGLIPVLSILSLVMGLYSLYLLFTGAGVVMSVPEDRAVGYGVAVLVATFAVFIILAYLATRIAGRGMM